MRLRNAAKGELGSIVGAGFCRRFFAKPCLFASPDFAGRDAVACLLFGLLLGFLPARAARFARDMGCQSQFSGLSAWGSEEAGVSDAGSFDVGSFDVGSSDASLSGAGSSDVGSVDISCGFGLMQR